MLWEDGEVVSVYRGDTVVHAADGVVYDLLSLRLALRLDLAGDRLPPRYEVVDGRGRLRTIEVVRAGTESVRTGLGRVDAERLEYSTRSDRRYVVWFAPGEKHWHGAAPDAAELAAARDALLAAMGPDLAFLETELVALERSGDVVFAPNPTYPIHPYSSIISGGDVRGIPAGPDQDFFENLISATKQTWPRPKILVISYPHNPTTEVVDLAFFEKIVD